MAKIDRVLQKIFGSTGGSGEFGKFGSDSLGAAATTKDIAQIQSLAPYLQGWFAATNNANEPPRIQDMNGLFLMLTTQLGYLFQNGIPEWEAGTSYYTTVSYCQRGGVIYRSKTDDNINHDPATDDGTYWEAGDSFYRQLKWDLDTLGFTGYALYTDKYLMDKLRIARRAIVGETVFSSAKITPTAFSSARSTAAPTNAEYAPYVDRSEDHDLAIANYPLLAALKDQKASFKGTTDFTATISGSTITMPNNAAGIAAVQKIADDALFAGWLNSSQAADPVADFTTASSQRCVNIAGTDYAITGANPGTRTITVSESPATGSQTVIFYPLRIAGSTNIRLHAWKGAVPVVDGDSDGENVNGYRKLDRGQLHIHSGNGLISLGGSVIINNSGNAGRNSAPTGLPITAGALTGTPRNGKTTDPRGFGQYVYTFVGLYL